MKPGDLVSIHRIPIQALGHHDHHAGYGIYFGLGTRGKEVEPRWYSVFYNGRLATFDPAYWEFEVISEGR
jgi:hypothetical protein